MIGTLHLETDSPSMSGADVTGQTFGVLQDVARERQRQDAKWGEQSHPPEWWMAILTEEVGEAAQEVLGLRYGTAAKARGDLRTELLHVAAVAVSAIETLDHGAAGLGRPETRLCECTFSCCPDALPGALHCRVKRGRPMNVMTAEREVDAAVGVAAPIDDGGQPHGA